MSKELEALKRIEYFVNEEMGIKTFNQSGWHIEGTDDYQLVKEGLERLEAIDNANPSKALERTSSEFIDDYPTGNVNIGMTWEEHSAIKQALIKAQEQEKVLKVILKKQVDINEIKIMISNLKHCDDIERCKRYNASRKVGYKLKQEDFNSIKEMLNNEITR